MDAPAAAVSADGKKIAVGWMDMRRGAGEKDAFWRTIDKGKLLKTEPLGPDSDGTQGHVALAIDDKGVFHAVWESEGKILYRTSAAPEPKVVGDGGQPGLAFRDGVLLVAFEAGRSSSVRRVE